jgi:uncharacterized protein (DUF697 family)
VSSQEEKIVYELERWQQRMKREISFTGRLARKLQIRINRVIPEKVHHAITTAIKQMTRAVCLGAEYTTPTPLDHESLAERELKALERIKFYRNTAAIEGAVTGAGGILLGLADFPIWLGLKMKMLFEIAAIYGFNVANYKERIYLLYIFELTFSNQSHRNKIFSILENWSTHQHKLPADINDFDWRSFQQEYRDHIDLAKLLQLVPGIGAPVGALVNHRLTNRLGEFAMNAFRMRWLNGKKIAGRFYPA